MRSSFNGSHVAAAVGLVVAGCGAEVVVVIGTTIAAVVDADVGVCVVGCVALLVVVIGIRVVETATGGCVAPQFC